MLRRDPIPFVRLCLLSSGIPKQTGQVFDRSRSRAENGLPAIDWLELAAVGGGVDESRNPALSFSV